MRVRTAEHSLLISQGHWFKGRRWNGNPFASCKDESAQNESGSYQTIDEKNHKLSKVKYKNLIKTGKHVNKIEIHLKQQQYLYKIRYHSFWN